MAPRLVHAVPNTARSVVVSSPRCSLRSSLAPTSETPTPDRSIRSRPSCRSRRTSLRGITLGASTTISATVAPVAASIRASVDRRGSARPFSIRDSCAIVTPLRWLTSERVRRIASRRLRNSDPVLQRRRLLSILLFYYINLFRQYHNSPSWFHRHSCAPAGPDNARAGRGGIMGVWPGCIHSGCRRMLLHPSVRYSQPCSNSRTHGGCSTRSRGSPDATADRVTARQTSFCCIPTTG